MTPDPTSPGRPVSTRRGRRAGARELRTWVSADEYAEVERLAAIAGQKLGDYLRERALQPKDQP